MALTDLTGTKWRFNERITAFGVVLSRFAINFTSNDQTFSQIRFDLQSIEGWALGYDSTRVYDTGAWLNQAYRLIEITGGTAATNSTLISWIQSNAEQVIEVGTKLLKSGTFVIGKINGHYVSSVNGTNVMSGIVADAPTGYEVTITFQNGMNNEGWNSTRIFDDYIDGSTIPASAQQIGSISSADGSATVTTNTGKLAIFAQSDGVIRSSPPTINGGVSLSGTGDRYGEEYGYVWAFDVTGNGTVTINHIDWDRLGEVN